MAAHAAIPLDWRHCAVRDTASFLTKNTKRVKATKGREARLVPPQAWVDAPEREDGPSRCFVALILRVLREESCRRAIQTDRSDEARMLRRHFRQGGFHCNDPLLGGYIVWVPIIGRLGA